MQQRVTTEEFIEKARKVHGDKYDYSKVEYINSKTKVCIICPEHGEFWQTPNCHLSGRSGCYFCSKEKCAENYRKKEEDFIKEARKIHGDKYDYSKIKYVNNKTKVCIICPEHGEFWQTPVSHLKGCGCIKCGIESRILKQSLTKEEFEKRANIIHKYRYDYSKVVYKNVDSKVKIICPIHGEFFQTPYHHINGCGCPKCNSSMLENIIRKTLNDNKIEFIEQKKFPWLKSKKAMSLDFYLPDYNIAIECQGGQHFKPGHFYDTKDEVESLEKFREQVLRDELKYNLCKENGITILYYLKGKVPKNFENKYKYYRDSIELLNEIKAKKRA